MRHVITIYQLRVFFLNSFNFSSFNLAKSPRSKESRQRQDEPSSGEPSAIGRSEDRGKRVSGASNRKESRRQVESPQCSEKIQALDPASIRNPLEERLEPIDWLVTSISEHGLNTSPIVTREEEDAYTVVAGRKRIAACKKLGLRSIDCRIIEFAQRVDSHTREIIISQIRIDENLSREDLPAIEEVVDLATSKAIYEALHPETKVGGAPGRGGGGKKKRTKNENISSFAEYAGKKYRQHPRTIQLKVKIGNALQPYSARLLRTAVSDNFGQLVLLSNIDDEHEREQIVDMISSGKISSVTEALQSLGTPSSLNIKEEPEIPLLNKVEEVSDNTIDLIFTSPLEQPGRRAVAESLRKISQRVLKPGSALVVYAAPEYLLDLHQFMQNEAKDFGPDLRFVALGGIYRKREITNDEKRRHSRHWTGVLIYEKGETSRTESFSDLYIPSNIATESSEDEKGIRYLVEKLSSPGAKVFDPFCASPFILEAARKSGRNVIGVKSAIQ